MLWRTAEDTLQKGPPCVLDVALSLAPAGLYWTLGLAQILPVWLPQCHWAIVDDSSFLGDEQLVTRLAGVPDPSTASTILTRVREDWRRARDEMALEARPGFFWPADARYESVVPKDNDGGVIERVHLLAAGLEGRRRSPDELPGPPNALADCARDTLALAVALADRRTIILSPLGINDASPLLADHLIGAGIECPELTNETLIEALRATFLPALFASGMAVALANGRLRLAGLLLAAPGALAAASLAEGMVEDSLELNSTADRGEAGLWNGTEAGWVNL
jgi:hypothetical protein